MNEIVRRTKWAELIRAAWKQSAECILETGRLLTKAKADLEHGEWLNLVNAELQFGERTAQRLMAIGCDQRLVNPSILPLLPHRWTKIHGIHKLEGEDFERALRNPQSIKATNRANRERQLGQKQTELPNAQFGVIVADPEWRFEPWSRTTGMDRAADNHYPTSCLEIIASRPVQLIAANDCVLFLWATAPMLPEAFLVMGAWGFDYRSNYIWSKDRIGTGYWNRNAHEQLLVGVKGNIPAPAPGTQLPSVLEGKVTKHSAKPERFLEMIEGYFPTLPKIELNRRGPARSGWSAWGNESDSEPTTSTPTGIPDVVVAASDGPLTEDAAPVPGLSAANDQSGTGVSFWADR